MFQANPVITYVHPLCRLPTASRHHSVGGSRPLVADRFHSLTSARRGRRIRAAPASRFELLSLPPTSRACSKPRGVCVVVKQGRLLLTPLFVTLWCAAPARCACRVDRTQTCLHERIEHPRRELAQCRRAGLGGLHLQYHRIRAGRLAQRHWPFVRHAAVTGRPDADHLRLGGGADVAADDAADPGGTGCTMSNTISSAR